MTVGSRPTATTLTETLLVVTAAAAVVDTGYVGHLDVDQLEFRGLHLTALAAGAPAAVASVSSRRHPRRSVLVGGAALSVIVLVWSTLPAAANPQRGLDLVCGIVVAAAVASLPPGSRRRVAVGLGAVMAATAVLALAVHLVGDPDSSRWRGQATSLGDLDRLTRPFTHVNVAAMVFGPATAALAVAAASTRSRLAVAAAALCAFALVLTASRGGTVALAVALVVGGTIAVARRRPSGLVTAAALLSVMIGAVVATDLGRVRWLGASQYDVDISAPSALVVDGASEPPTATIEVVNRSDRTFDPRDGRMILLASWLNEEMDWRYVDQVWDIDQPIGSGESWSITVVVPAQVADGDYLVAWEVARDGVVAFRAASGAAPVLTTVQVTGSDAVLAGGPLAGGLPPSARADVWSWAVDAVEERPWAGWGLGGFRAATQRSAILDGRQSAGHAHSIVLEPVVAVGLPVALLLLGASTIWLLRAARRVDDPASWAALAALAVLVSHGLVEWPFAFTAVIVPTAILVGLLTEPPTPTGVTSPSADAKVGVT